MKKFDKLLKGHKYICFLDFEGTQFSHEMIALGAVLATLDSKGKIKKIKTPYKCYVKAHNKIGRYVVELTSITEEILRNEGVSFLKAMEELKKYCGVAFRKCSFATFGNHDMTILSQSIAYNFDFPKEIVHQIQKNYIDISAFLSEFARDDKGNPLSLLNYCALFGAETIGPNHDPSSDAFNLCKLYGAFIEKPDIMLNEYQKVLANFSHLPVPLKNLVKRLVNGESVSHEDFENEIKDYIK